ncbi:MULTISPECIES: primosomal protein N' [Kamptonema]|uniref:primosomal protein N' n=1 Tax=Kamptonema TaxID=1501433 RepID=UPI0001DAC4F4|nr:MULTISPECIES: primosomal protein N' [Kamptonema]CBN53751.1 primosome assembly protein PriA [Kamptonema sp. PCC 6506]
MSTITFGLSPVLAESGISYGIGGDRDRPPARERWIEVLVDLPFEVSENNSEEQKEDKLYTYRLPPDLDVEPGDILSVPFGYQHLRAIAIRDLYELPSNLPPNRVKNVEDIVSKGFLSPTYRELLNRVATYYCTDLIHVIRASLPPGLLRRSQRRIRLLPDVIPSDVEIFLNPPALQVLQLLQSSKSDDYSYSWDYIDKQIKGASRGVKDLLQRNWAISYLEPPKTPKPKLKQAVTLIGNYLSVELSERQQEVLQILWNQGGEMWLTDFLNICNTTRQTLKRLEQNSCILIEEKEKLRLNQGIEKTPDVPKALTPYQIEALAVINNLSGFNQVLLHGVTGSGKTEVYLQAIAPILESGQSVLVLVPEIGLTPQLTDRFRARFGDQVCVYHSALSEGERFDTWRYMTQGIPQIVIGTRSAIFAPLPHLGLIILDEEHDSSFKQNEREPLYHARTVAKWRAELEDCPLILGSATPSLETWVETRRQKSSIKDYLSSLSNQENPQLPITNYPLPITDRQLPITHYLSLPERIYSRPMPPIEIADMRQELRIGNRSIFSLPLQNALQELQENQQQGILFIHRRGHSTFVSCRSCGYVMECPHCDVSLSYHNVREGAAQILRCHYCNHSEIQPRNCPECGSPYFKNFGSGTQRVEQELTRLFPELRVIRFDSDTTKTKDAHRILLTKFANGEAEILLGTQMLTKGLDLAQVTLVGVVSADGLLHFSDYRANERAFQILTQVAGRAGRGDDPGRVIIQTYTPEHPVIQAVRRHESESFLEAELQERSQLNYPPSGRLILLRLSGYNGAEVEQTAINLALFLSSREQENIYELLGPAPAPIMRVANRYRWHILLKLPVNASIELPLARLRDRTPRSVSLTIDVDPLNLG